MKSTATLTIAMLLTTSGAALAQDGSPFNNSYTLGVLMVPEFEGSDDYQAAPLLGFRIDRGNRWLEFQGLGLRANLLDSPMLEVGPVLNYRMGRDDDVENSFVASLPEVDDSTELGVFFTYKIPAGQGGFSFGAEVLQDVSDAHEGWLGTLSAGYGAEIGNGWSIGSKVSATLISDDYADAYFSTDTFTAEGGWKDVGIDLSVSYALNDQSSILGFIGYRRLLDDAADSPITQSGSEDQMAIGVGYSRRF
jgi:MipA family protein